MQIQYSDTFFYVWIQVFELVLLKNTLLLGYFPLFYSEFVTLAVYQPLGFYGKQG